MTAPPDSSIPLDKWPTLAEVAKTTGPATLKEIVRGLLHAASEWPLDEMPPPDDLIADLRFALTVEDLGGSMLTEIARHLHLLTHNESN